MLMGVSKCYGCNTEVEVPKDYKPEYCCDGLECGLFRISY